MAVKKQQFWKAKQSTSKPETSVGKTQDSEHTTASGHDVRSDKYSFGCAAQKLPKTCGFSGSLA